MTHKKLLYAAVFICTANVGTAFAAIAEKQSFEEEHIISINVKEKYNIVTPDIVFPSTPVTGANGDELFSLDVYIPERVSKVRLYPVSAPDTGIGSMVSIENSANTINYKIVDSNNKTMKRDEIGTDVTPNGQPVRFRAISTANNEKSVSGGQFEDYVKVDYYVN